MPLHRYIVFGLQVDCALALPDLAAVAAIEPADVVIEIGTVPARRSPEPAGLYIVPHGAILHIPEAGRYLIENGRRIVVDPAADATERSVRLYLLGSAFAAILHQRRMLPLHANTIDFDGAAVAFMGHSGAGKSTLANWFHDQGRPILGDDVCVVRNNAAGAAEVVPGLPRIRLWGDALSASGRRASDYQASFDDMDKYDVPLAVEAARTPLPLAAVYLLRAADPDGGGAIEPLAGMAAVQALVENTYRGGYLPLMGGTATHLQQCVSLLRRVPIFSLQRRWGLDVFATEAAAVEAHVRSVLTPDAVLG